MPELKGEARRQVEEILAAKQVEVALPMADGRPAEVVRVEPTKHGLAKLITALLILGLYDAARKDLGQKEEE